MSGYRLYALQGYLVDFRHVLDPEVAGEIQRRLSTMGNREADELLRVFHDMIDSNPRLKLISGGHDRAR